MGKLEDGTIFEKKGHDGEELFEFTTDEGLIILSTKLLFRSLDLGTSENY